MERRWHFAFLSPCSKCWIHGLEERAVVLQTGKRAGVEAPFDVYVCTSLLILDILSNPMVNLLIKIVFSCLDRGLQWLSEEFSLCFPLKKKADSVNFKAFLQETWVNLAMVDYPYKANFLQPLPRWPIQVNMTTNYLIWHKFLPIKCFNFLKFPYFFQWTKFPQT